LVLLLSLSASSSPSYPSRASLLEAALHILGNFDHAETQGTKMCCGRI
jgi:hypothetical protein